ncbi:MAG TPA: hypothetical protein VFO77_04915 [Actinoplanes sp.]|nr:hypothetical protein [Actinoplanes sp.]
MNRAEQQVARLARVHDGQLAGIGNGPAAQQLLARLTAEPARPQAAPAAAPVRRGPLVGRVRLGFAAAPVAVLTGTLVVGPGLPGTATSYANSAISVHREDGFYIARIADPLADHERYSEAFRAVGLDVTIELVPVPPARVGQLLDSGSGGSSGRVVTELVGTGPAPVDCSVQPAACTIVMRISADTDGDVRYRLGRAAAPGEAYATDPDLPGPVRPDGN